MPALPQDAIQRFRFVPDRIDLLAIKSVVSQLHHVIKAALLSANMQNIHLAFVRTGYRLEPLDPFVFSLKWPFVLERSCVNDLHCPKGAHDVACEPYLPVTAFADQSQQ